MCARFTVLNETPIASAIAGCVIPLSRSSTIWMRSRCAAGIFHRSAVFNCRICFLVHLTIRPPESDSQSESYRVPSCETEKRQKSPDSNSYGSGINSYAIGFVRQHFASTVQQNLAKRVADKFPLQLGTENPLLSHKLEQRTTRLRQLGRIAPSGSAVSKTPSIVANSCPKRCVFSTKRSVSEGFDGRCRRRPTMRIYRLLDDRVGCLKGVVHQIAANGTTLVRYPVRCPRLR